jgi:hypothetical protein
MVYLWQRSGRDIKFMSWACVGSTAWINTTRTEPPPIPEVPLSNFELQTMPAAERDQIVSEAVTSYWRGSVLNRDP